MPDPMDDQALADEMLEALLDRLITRHGGALAPELHDQYLPDYGNDLDASNDIRNGLNRRRHGWGASPDKELWDERMAELLAKSVIDRETTTDRSGNNPAFTIVRGGPFGADVGRSGNPARDLADFLRGSGVAEPIASQYEKRAVGFGPGGYNAGNGRINLSDFLSSNAYAAPMGVAQHEGVHSYDESQVDSQGRRLTRSDPFTIALAAALRDYPELSDYISKTTLQSDRFLPEHSFTAAFDTQRTMDEIPPPLQPFYEGLLPRRNPRY